MVFKRTLAAVAASVFAMSANAYVIEFDVSGLYMSDETGPGCCYAPTGTYRFDTTTQNVYDVSISSPFETYLSGSYDSGSQYFGLFSVGLEDADPTTAPLVIDFKLEFATILAAVTGGTVGDTYTFGVEPYEKDNENATIYGAANDPTLYAKLISTDPAPAVPLPASLPLMLAGLAGLGVAARRKS